MKIGKDIQDLYNAFIEMTYLTLIEYATPQYNTHSSKVYMDVCLTIKTSLNFRELKSYKVCFLISVGLN